MSNIQRLMLCPNETLSPAEGIIEGQPMEHRLDQFTDPKGMVDTGSWYCTPGKLSFMDYPCDEICFVTEGKLGLVDLSTAEEQIFAAGEAFICRKGSDLQWNIYEATRKFFVTLN